MLSCHACCYPKYLSYGLPSLNRISLSHFSNQTRWSIRHARDVNRLAHVLVHKRQSVGQELFCRASGGLEQQFEERGKREAKKES
jgi:hypothetical protein